MTFEFSKQITRHLAHDVHQHIQTTPVCHAHHNFLHARLAGMVDEFIHRSDKAVAAFEGETLLTHIFCVEITLKAFGLGELLQKVALALCRHGRG